MSFDAGRCRWLDTPRHVFAICMLLAPVSAGCQQHTASGTEKGAAAVRKPRQVQIAQVRLIEWPRVVRVQGSLFGHEHAVVGAKVAGRVKRVDVDLGSSVEQHQVLAELETEEFDLRVQQAEAQLMQARASLGLQPGEPDSSLDRMKSPPVVQEKAMMDEARLAVERARALARQGVITTEELQQREAANSVAAARFNSSLNGVDEKIAILAVRRAELAQAIQVQTDATTFAPFTGVVQARHVAPGVYLQVGQPVITLVRTDPLRFRAGVPEREATSVLIDQDIELSIEGQAKPLRAKISRISPALDMSSRSLMVEADIPNADGLLRTGLFAEAEIVVDALERVIAVDEAAVMEFAGVQKVWLVRDGAAAEQRVATGRRARGMVEIVGGLNAGDMVVADVEQGHAGPVIVQVDAKPADEAATRDGRSAVNAGAAAHSSTAGH